MPKRHSLRRREEFDYVLRGGRGWASPWLVLKARPNTEEHPRLGYIVSKKVGSSVIRNKFKRWLREVIRQERLRTWDLVFIVRSVSPPPDFATFRQAIRDLLRRSHLLEEQEEDAQES